MTYLSWEKQQFKEEILEDLRNKARRSSVFKKWRNRWSWWIRWVDKPPAGGCAPYDFYKVSAFFDNDETPGEFVKVEMVLHGHSTSQSKNDIIRILKVVLADAEANIDPGFLPQNKDDPR